MLPQLILFLRVSLWEHLVVPVVAKVPFAHVPCIQEDCFTEGSAEEMAVCSSGGGGSALLGQYNLLLSLGIAKVNFDDYDFPLHNNFKITLFPPPHCLCTSSSFCVSHPTCSFTVVY